MPQPVDRTPNAWPDQDDNSIGMGLLVQLSEVPCQKKLQVEPRAMAVRTLIDSGKQRVS
jgi:hypothetical protein